MTTDHNSQQLKNCQALLAPKPGDYWNEMFCPYFIVVDVRGDDITVLSCMGGPKSYNRKDEPNAYVDRGDGWSFDYSKSMVVDRAWMERAVRYDTIDGFVADVTRSEKTEAIVTEWRDWRQKQIRQQISALESEWEEFTGWQDLKSEDKKNA